MFKKSLRGLRVHLRPRRARNSLFLFVVIVFFKDEGLKDFSKKDLNFAHHLRDHQTRARFLSLTALSNTRTLYGLLFYLVRVVLRYSSSSSFKHIILLLLIRGLFATIKSKAKSPKSPIACAYLCLGFLSVSNKTDFLKRQREGRKIIRRFSFSFSSLGTVFCALVNSCTLVR